MKYSCKMRVNFTVFANISKYISYKQIKTVKYYHN